jgi:cytochrome d ubiquinol oxidase subunit II
VLLWGAVLGVLTHGLALGADGQVTGAGLSRSTAPLLSRAALAGAGAALFAALLIGAMFLTLRTTGPVHLRARRLGITLATGGGAVLVAVGFGTGSRPVLAAAVLCLGIAMVARSGREALAFGGTALSIAGAVVAVFLAPGDVVLRSTLDPAWSLTMTGAAATDSALRLISVVGVVVLPGVIVYQAFSYWVFRRRVASQRVASEPTTPEPATREPANREPATDERVAS